MAQDAANRVDVRAQINSRDARASSLLARIRAGDREAAAEFVLQFGPILRQRVRSKLTGGLRRLVDSADLLASVARRLDRAVAERRAWFETESQLFSFVNRIASRLVVDQARVLNRLQRAESHEAAWAHSMYARIANADSRDGAGFDTVIDDAMSALESERDRRVLSLWLMGMNHNEIASEMGANPAAVRQQWCRMRQRLASALGAELEDAARSKSGASNAA